MSCGDDDVTIDDELELTRSAFEGCCSVEWNEKTRRVTVVAGSSRDRSLSFRLGEDYPQKGSIAFDDPDHVTSSSIFDVVRRFVDSATADGDDDGEAVVTSPFMTSLLHFDHMRDRPRYLRHLRAFHASLPASSRCHVIFVRGSRHVTAVLGSRQGESCERFVADVRGTRGIDVDSKGRACREKMMRVVCSNREIEQESKFAADDDGEGFKVFELESRDELREHFTELGIAHLYQEYLA